PAELGDNPLAVAGEGAAAYLTNSAGSALYYVEGDRDGSGCTGECVSAWPPLLVGDAMPGASAGLQAGMIGTVTRPDGQRQVTYNGHPLYRYAADTGLGEAAGSEVRDQWGRWRLIGPDGEAVAGAQSPRRRSASSSSCLRSFWQAPRIAPSMVSSLWLAATGSAPLGRASSAHCLSCSPGLVALASDR